MGETIGRLRAGATNPAVEVDSVTKATTFEVDHVIKVENLLPLANDTLEIVTQKIKAKSESCCKLAANVCPVRSNYIQNSFVEAVHTAYDKHYPLVLSPDIIWQCVAQGFTIHVNKNAEKLRHMFVAHEGKKLLKVSLDGFVKGSPDNDWEQALGAFSEEIRKNVGNEIYNLLTPDFSTAGPVEKAASQILFMSTFKEDFSYACGTVCGIPSITLEGTVEDWKKLREKTLSLSRFDFKWWTEAIEPIFDEFVDAKCGVVNRKFWQTIYKVSGGSGGPYITGWMIALFPYIGNNLENLHPNRFLHEWERVRQLEGVTTDQFPPGIANTPFSWQYSSGEYDMYFYTGFMGVGQDKKTLALKPIIGWAVVDKEEEEKSKMNRRARIGL